MQIGARLVHATIESGRISESVLEILGSNRLCSIATVTAAGQPHINTAFFVVEESTLSLYFLSDPASLHAVNLHGNPHAAVTVFHSQQIWGDSLVGLQLFGSAAGAAEAVSATAESLYRQRFPAYQEWFDSLDAKAKASFRSRFYRFVPERLKLLDEARFGEETFVGCAIERP